MLNSDFKNLAMPNSQMVRAFPLEDLLEKYINGIGLGEYTDDQSLLNQLQFAQKLCNKALKLLPHDIDVRGHKEILTAIEKVEKLKKKIDPVVNVLLAEQKRI